MATNTPASAVNQTRVGPTKGSRSIDHAEGRVGRGSGDGGGTAGTDSGAGATVVVRTPPLVVCGASGRTIGGCWDPSRELTGSFTMRSRRGRRPRRGAGSCAGVRTLGGMAGLSSYPSIPRRGRALASLGAIALGLGLLTACGSGSDTAHDAPAAIAEAGSAADVVTLDAEAFRARTQEPGVVVLDVRTPEEFAEGHLAGAVNVDASAPDFDGQVSELDADAAYAVYCRSGSRSEAAVERMQAAGFTDVEHLGGGIIAWQEAGLPVE